VSTKDAKWPGYCIAQEVDGVREKGVRRYNTVQHTGNFAGFLDDSETWGLSSSSAEVSGFLDTKLPD
jgi:hypothetical protein